MKRNESPDSTNSKKPKLHMGEDQQAEKEEFFQPVGQAAEEVDHEQVPENDNDGIRMTGAEDAQGHPVQEIDSLCMNCHETGVSRLLLTSIPYFREIVVISFECPHCGFKNSEIQPASTIAEKGSRYVLKIENKEDFNRQVVKSDYCTCKFIELDIEIPAKRGQLTTVEGLLSEMVQDLEMDQPQRKEVQPEIYEKIEQFLAKIRSVLNGETGLPLTFLIDDPSGNSWIEYVPGEPQHKWSMVEYNRTPQQNVMLGLVSADEVAAHEQEQQQQQPQRVRATGFMSDETDIENFANEVQVNAWRKIHHFGRSLAPGQRRAAFPRVPGNFRLDGSRVQGQLGKVLRKTRYRSCWKNEIHSDNGRPVGVIVHPKRVCSGRRSKHEGGRV
ncbi:hypothetical protein KL909_001781 [Ogataea angusta]|nr:hypothetical protein KL909_001781 [Ogataea angusta]